MTNYLSQLTKITQRKSKRLGRGAGSGKGAKSGRGTTRHQTAREKVPAHFEGGQAKMTKKFPLLRGKSRNKSVRLKPRIIKLSELNLFKAAETVNLESLLKKGLIVDNDMRRGVKIIGGGKLEKKLTVKVPASKSVIKEIEKLSGKYEV